MGDERPGILRGAGMNPSDQSSLATRASLLGRLKDLEDQASWQQFFDTYWQLIYSIALKAGLTDAEAQDAVQETIISVAKHLPGFHYHPKVCSFKTWLLRLARWRIIDQIRKRLPLRQHEEGQPDDDVTAIAELDRLTGGKAPEVEKLWTAEWQKLMLSEAIEVVKRRVRPEQFQIFDLYVCKGMAVSEVAKLLGVGAARVYLTKHRVGALVKKEVRRLEQELP
jgi:RNA polymerase sigma-70 factor (ECF subfamily)